tara:strand:+ start:4950 stop:5942 length:993 start_codon:yes stop_codon:yes gene_type:complete
MKKIRIGVLGLANIATRSIIPTIKKLPNLYNFVGIASRDYKKGKKLSEILNCFVFSDYDDLLVNGDLDAVYIPLPNSLHFKWAKLALKQNIHVLVEKPLAVSLLEVQQLTNIARKKKLILFETFQFRFHNQLIKIKDLLEKESIGEIRNLRATFCFPPLPNIENIRYQKDLNGGCLLDAGAYTVKISQILLGNNLEVVGSSLTIPEGKDVEIWGSAMLQNERKDITSFLHFGFDNFYKCGIEILGSKGEIYTNRLFTAPNDYEALIYLKNNSSSVELKVDKDDHFVKMLKYFYKLATEKKYLEKEYIDNLDQARIMDTIKKKSGLLMIKN